MLSRSYKSSVHVVTWLLVGQGSVHMLEYDSRPSPASRHECIPRRRSTVPGMCLRGEPPRASCSSSAVPSRRATQHVQWRPAALTDARCGQQRGSRGALHDDCTRTPTALRSANLGLAEVHLGVLLHELFKHVLLALLVRRRQARRLLPLVVHHLLHRLARVSVEIRKL